MRTTIVIRLADGREEELVGNSIEVTEQGVLHIFNDQVSAKTTTREVNFLLWKEAKTETIIETKRYTSASYPADHWIAAYAKTTKVIAEVGK